MGAEVADIKDPGAVAFFMGELCGEADLIYRFGYTLTLSEVGASKLVEKTFAAIVGQIARFFSMESQQIRLELLKISWGIFLDQKEKFTETDTPMLDFLYSLSREVRVVLVLVDVLGLSKDEVQNVLELKTIEIQRYLAEGRRQMLNQQQ